MAGFELTLYGRIWVTPKAEAQTGVALDGVVGHSALKSLTRFG